MGTFFETYWRAWRYISLIGCIFLAACGNISLTETTSFVDRSLVTSPRQVQSIIVRAEDMTLKEALTAENAMVAEFGELSVAAIASTEVLPPTRTFSASEASKRMADTGADGVLLVGLRGKDISKTYVPETYHPGESRTDVSVVGGQAIATTTTDPGYTTGGYTIERPLSAYQARYIDLKTGQPLWTAELNSRGLSSSSFADLAADASASAVRRLIEDGVIASPAAAESPS